MGNVVVFCFDPPPVSFDIVLKNANNFDWGFHLSSQSLFPLSICKIHHLTNYQGVLQLLPSAPGGGISLMKYFCPKYPKQKAKSPKKLDTLEKKCTQRPDLNKIPRITLSSHNNMQLWTCKEPQHKRRRAEDVLEMCSKYKKKLLKTNVMHSVSCFAFG